MAITQIQVLVPGAGTAVVPSPGDDDEVSDGWEESSIAPAGRVAIEDADGGRAEFGPGEAFLVPARFDGCRHTLGPTRKIFVGVSAR
ncbi:hypothetical protein [Nonomuraea bangladeshensis]|uniref:hypothetical protein n=1 Tax=Nonomuraea bangladeshensis TaxID=404385 RepID=UPI003C2E369E